jgi:hypothetical protein
MKEIIFFGKLSPKWKIKNVSITLIKFYEKVLAITCLSICRNTNMLLIGTLLMRLINEEKIRLLKLNRQQN